MTTLSWREADRRQREVDAWYRKQDEGTRQFHHQHRPGKLSARANRIIDALCSKRSLVRSIENGRAAAPEWVKVDSNIEWATRMLESHRQALLRYIERDLGGSAEEFHAMLFGFLGGVDDEAKFRKEITWALRLLEREADRAARAAERGADAATVARWNAAAGEVVMVSRAPSREAAGEDIQPEGATMRELTEAENEAAAEEFYGPDGPPPGAVRAGGHGVPQGEEEQQIANEAQAESAAERREHEFPDVDPSVPEPAEVADEMWRGLKSSAQAAMEYETFVGQVVDALVSYARAVAPGELAEARTLVDTLSKEVGDAGVAIHELEETVAGQRSRIADLEGRMRVRDRMESRGIRIGATYLDEEATAELRWAVKATIERTDKAIKAVEKEEMDESVAPLKERMERLQALKKLLAPGGTIDAVAEAKVGSHAPPPALAADDRQLAVLGQEEPEGAKPSDPFDVLLLRLGERFTKPEDFFTREATSEWTEDERAAVLAWLDNAAGWDQAEADPEVTEEEREAVAIEHERAMPLPLAALVYDIERTRNLLSLVEAEHPSLEEIGEWADADRVEAARWAAAVHIHASDHDDYPVPPIPQVVLDFKVGDGPFGARASGDGFAVYSRDGRHQEEHEEPAGDFVHFPFYGLAINEARGWNEQAPDEPFDVVAFARAMTEPEVGPGDEDDVPFSTGDVHLDTLREALEPGSSRGVHHWRSRLPLADDLLEASAAEWIGEGEKRLDTATDRKVQVERLGSGHYTFRVFPGGDVRPKSWSGAAAAGAVRRALADFAFPTPEETAETWDSLGHGEAGLDDEQIAGALDGSLVGDERDAALAGVAADDDAYEVFTGAADVLAETDDVFGTGTRPADVPDPSSPEPRERYVVEGARKPVKIVDTDTGQVVVDGLSLSEAKAKAKAWNRSPDAVRALLGPQHPADDTPPPPAAAYAAEGGEDPFPASEPATPVGAGSVGVESVVEPESPVDRILRHALLRREGSSSRWDAVRRKRASDEDLARAISVEFGADERFQLAEIGSARVIGGARPRAGIFVRGEAEPIKLEGAELLARVREVMDIERPAPTPAAPAAVDLDNICIDCFGPLVDGVCQDQECPAYGKDPHAFSAP